MKKQHDARRLTFVRTRRRFRQPTRQDASQEGGRGGEARALGPWAVQLEPEGAKETAIGFLHPVSYTHLTLPTILLV